MPGRRRFPIQGSALLKQAESIWDATDAKAVRAVAHLGMDEPEFFSDCSGGQSTFTDLLKLAYDPDLDATIEQRVDPDLPNDKRYARIDQRTTNHYDGLPTHERMKVFINLCDRTSHGEFLGAALGSYPVWSKELSEAELFLATAAVAEGIKYAADHGVDH